MPGQSEVDRVPVADLGGRAMPLLGYGTHPMRGGQATEAVLAALEVGYRLVDTATRYRNEEAIGAALAQTAVPRGELFVTTKMPPDCVGIERRTLEESLTALGTDHVDLWLIHWPPGGYPGVTSWRAFAQAREEGLVRAMGVSNYPIELIDALYQATGEYPAVNQRQWGPGDYDAGYAGALAARGIVLSAHSPLRSTDLNDPVLLSVAQAHDRSVHEVVVAWNLHHGVAVTVKSAHRERMVRNLSAAGLTLTEEEVAAIDRLGAGR
ncbi:diketogulonate reductase-like aldo/keto reductase [Amycolatopsis sulphurea]|uniref:Diketogulonate reductase-like aldo/keto reductase n=1 Tax=Amycolatopsis sulphurea TaxID=76022 RepID=A0A2A9FI33_9PSEU|nr:aldo/keto reductase [Amycolatopsis sulphurea]PFG51034.1 diketogulonate reductase-like aldo/keto reductase [Amycolatopsis sulphurea]